MSWFGRDFTTLCSSEDHCTVTDTDLDVEVADGVVVERRSVLWLSGAAVASVLAGGVTAQDKRQDQKKGQQQKAQQQKAQQQKAQQQGAGKLTFEQFFAEIHPLAQRIIKSKGQDEDAYLMTVAAALTRLAEPGGDVRKAMRAFRQKHQGDGKTRFPISAVTMRLRPGKGFPHHDHRNYNGVILGVAGECRIKNFDILGDDKTPKEGKTFQIRQTCDDLILPGRISQVGRTRDNIHELVAGKDGAQLLDVFTFFGKGATSKYMNVEARPRDAERRIYDAAWRPSRRRGR